MVCCSCGARSLETLLDLGLQPDPDSLIELGDPRPAPQAPVVLTICPACGLVQLPGPRPDGPRPAHGHAMAMSKGDPWIGTIERFLPSGPRVVIDVDGSGGLPAERFSNAGRVFAGMPSDVAEASELILVGHALSHVEDFDGLLRRVEASLAPKGVVAIDFHHVLGLADGQFDVVAHTHRTYLSLISLDRALDRHGLEVIAARRITEYGGTMQVLAARRADDLGIDDDAFAPQLVRTAETAAQIDCATGFVDLRRRVQDTCSQLVDHLEDLRRSGRTVAGYGAAARGTTLLNIAGIGKDQVAFVVDRAPAKQDKLLPGAMIRVGAPSEIATARPDDVIILPWPSASEIAGDLMYTQSWGARCFVALPRLEVLQ